MTPADDRDPVDVLAEEFVERLRRGEHPSVSDYATAHPDHAEQLRELLPAVAQMECLKKLRRSSGFMAAERPQLPDRFGDFRIVRELGRGGMGVVFEAEQESLGRNVALKVLATHSQFDVVRHERFIREAHAAARLHHTNIVPVFGVGEQDGIPYYVMQLIRGQGLNTVAQRWRREEGRGDAVSHISTPMAVAHDSSPTPMTVAAPASNAQAVPPTRYETNPTIKYGNWRFVAEVGLQSAEALHYAHKQGVLHRDVKPANLLLDSSNRVWITDFGLAKVIDLNGITASGDILGTLQYLAPECLTGDSDPRSDVYGVGATLYELLTLRPPYPTDTPAKLIKLVGDTDPVPPRQINPDIPLDLETIVLKAMAREPDRRYVSAREFTRDLQAFLEDRPIKARRQTWTNRLSRWCRKNKAITALSGAAIAALLLAAVVGWVGYAQTQQALGNQAKKVEEAEKARLEADEARKKAELASAKLTENLQLSLAAFDAVFNAASSSRQGYSMVGWYRPGRTGFGAEGSLPGGFGLPPGPKNGPGPGGPGGPMPGGPGGPGGGPMAGGPGDPGGPRGNENAATDSSAKMMEAVLVFYDKFAEKNSTDPDLQLEAAKAHRRVGEARMWLGETAKARSSFARAIDLLKSLQEKYPEKDRYALELVLTYLIAPPQLVEVSEQSLLWSLEVARGVDPHSQPYLVGQLSLKLASVHEHNGNAAGAETAYRDAIAALAMTQGIADNRPAPVVTDQAWARYCLALLVAKKGRKLDEACTVLAELIDELEKVEECNGKGSFPQNEVRFLAYDQLAAVYDQKGERDRAAEIRDLKQRKLSEGPGRPGHGPPGGGPGKGPPPKKF